MDINRIPCQIKERLQGREIISHRKESAESCGFGAGGTCCRVCNMGPCQLVEGVEELRGICGATASTVAARNFARLVAGGAAAHADYARLVLKSFWEAVKKKDLKEEKNLDFLKKTLGQDGDLEALARSLRDLFGQQSGDFPFLSIAPLKRKKIWETLNLIPRGIDREIVEIIHRTSIGVDQNHPSILKASLRCALADGWGSCLIATELQDALLGVPLAIKNLEEIDPWEKILQGSLKGIVLMMVGCEGLVPSSEADIAAAQAFLEKDVLLLVAGCAVKPLEEKGIFSSKDYAAFYLGPCPEVARLLKMLAFFISKNKDLEDFTRIPLVVCAPQWRSERAIVIGHFFVASGFPVVYGPNFPTSQSKIATSYLTQEMETLVGGQWKEGKGKELVSSVLSFLEERRKYLS